MFVTNSRYIFIFHQGIARKELCTVVAEGSSEITYSIDDTVNFEIIGGTIFTNREFDFEKPSEKQFKVWLISLLPHNCTLCLFW